MPHQVCFVTCRLVETRKHQDITSRLRSNREKELSHELEIARQEVAVLKKDIHQQITEKNRAQSEVHYQQQIVQSVKSVMEQTKLHEKEGLEAANKLNEDLLGRLAAQEKEAALAWRGNHSAFASIERGGSGVGILNDEIFRLRTENERLQAKTVELSSAKHDNPTVAYLDDEISLLTAENRRLYLAMPYANEGDSNTNTLDREIDRLKAENQRLLDSRTAAETQLNGQKQLVSKLKSELDIPKPRQTGQLEIPDRQIEELEGVLKARNEELSSIRAENEQLSNDKSVMKKAIQQQTAIVQTLKADLEGEVEEELKALAQQNERLEEEQASMEAELSKQNELIVQLRLDLKQAIPRELEALDEETDSQIDGIASIASIASQVEFRDREIALLKAENQRLLNGQNETAKHIESQRYLVEKLKADLEGEIEREINSLKVSSSALNTRYSFGIISPFLPLLFQRNCKKGTFLWRHSSLL